MTNNQLNVFRRNVIHTTKEYLFSVESTELEKLGMELQVVNVLDNNNSLQDMFLELVSVLNRNSKLKPLITKIEKIYNS